MEPEERERKINKLISEHCAAGGYIGREDAERVIDKAEKLRQKRVVKSQR